MGSITTFYSYKGGVGRTFALANIANLLARRNKKVLIMDWDLEAPGLHRYFNEWIARNDTHTKGLIHMLSEVASQGVIDWRDYIWKVDVPGGATINMITAGDHELDYAEKVRGFSWSHFFEQSFGGDILERWRREWKDLYDFILIDSRTGITDIGGVCTVLLPDILAFVFSANDQSFSNGLRIVKNVQQSRRYLDVPRPPLAVLPVPGRFDGRDEIDEATRWLDKFSSELKPFYDDWLPKQYSPRQILEITKIPYVAKFSFGEPIASITHGTTDPELPGFYFDIITRIIVSEFRDVSSLLSPDINDRESAVNDIRSMLLDPEIDFDKVHDILESIRLSIPNQVVVDLYTEAGVAANRHHKRQVAKDFLDVAIRVIRERGWKLDLSKKLAYSYVGDILVEQGLPQDAEQYYREAIELYEELAPASIVLANAYSDFAAIRRDQGDYVSSENYYRRCIDVLEESGPTGVSALPAVWNSLITTLREVGDYLGAEQACRNALSAIQRHFGDKHPVTLASYNNLGDILRITGRLGEAEEVFRGAITALEPIYRPNHPAMTALYSNLADILKLRGHLDEAINVYRHVLSVLSSQPSELATTASTMVNLGNVLQLRSQDDEAEFLYTEAIRLIERSSSVPGPWLRRARQSLTRLLMQQGRVTEARSFADERTSRILISYNHADRPLVHPLAKELVARGFDIWLDDWEIRIGDSLQASLHRAFSSSDVTLVCIGSSGIGPSQRHEIVELIKLQATRGMRIIPVLLPGFSSFEDLPVVLRDRRWLDLRDGLDEESSELIIRALTAILGR